ncbi:hypothetical protein [Sphingobium tyrosinilyticum]|uniref:Uncharacterized protein n=1 Tax=Sphingobium tyrosinilyticum TaxID=2715436 RepID=A0ABV9EY02_9SPHN
MSIAFIIWLIFKTLLLACAILLITPIAIAAAIGGYMLFEEDRSPQPATVCVWTWSRVRWSGLILWAKALSLLLLIVLIMSELARILIL